MSKDNKRRYREWDENNELDVYQNDLIETYDDDQIDTSYDVPKQRRRSTGIAPRVRVRPRPQPRQRRIWPWLLVGCLGGVALLVLATVLGLFFALRSFNSNGNLIGIPGNSSNATNYSQQVPPQHVPLTGITHITVQDPVGNVTITEDSSVTMPTISATKRVYATSSDAASTAYSRMNVQVQPSNTPTPTLTVLATVPNAGGLLGNHTSAIDLTITLPPSSVAALPTGTTSTPAATSTPGSIALPLTLTLTMSIGDATVTGVSGLLGIKNDIGNITVNNATLSDGSHLQTSTGNVTFAGRLDLTASGTSAPLYKLQSEAGNIGVTLPATTNVILDANTNVGTITSDFPITVQNTSGAASFYGPLLANSSLGQPQAVLTLNVSTGEVSIHKA